MLGSTVPLTSEYVVYAKVTTSIPTYPEKYHQQLQLVIPMCFPQFHLLLLSQLMPWLHPLPWVTGLATPQVDPAMSLHSSHRGFSYPS
jgi:hypothetical protein